MGSSNETSYFGPVRNPWDPRARARRLVGRFGGGGRRVPRAGRHRHRHRRLDPPAGGAHEPDRHQAHLRPRFALRHDRVRLEPRPGRRARRVRPRRGAAAARRWRASTRAIRPASIRRCRTTSAELDQPLKGLRVGMHPRVLRRRASIPPSSDCVREAIDAAAAGRRRRQGREPAEPAALGADVLRRRAGRVLVEPVALRRRALRPSLRSAEGPARSLQALARRGLRRRGQAPHHDRHLRALGGLLRRVLPQGAEVPCADRGRFRARLRRSRRRAEPHVARPRRSNSAPRPAIRSRCT